MRRTNQVTNDQVWAAPAMLHITIDTQTKKPAAVVYGDKETRIVHLDHTDFETMKTVLTNVVAKTIDKNGNPCDFGAAVRRVRRNGTFVALPLTANAAQSLFLAAYIRNGSKMTPTMTPNQAAYSIPLA